MNQHYTAESVTEGHPDKLCDIIADRVLDECLAHDALSRVACEVLATKGQVIVAGEITSLYEPDIPSIVQSVFRKAGYDPTSFSIQCLLHRQSSDIAAGVGCSLERRRNLSKDQPAPATRGRRSGRHGGLCLFGNAADDASAGGAGAPSYQRPLCRPENRDDTGPAPGRKSAGHCRIRQGWKTSAAGRCRPFGPAQPGKPKDELSWELTDKVLAPALQALPPDKDTKILLNPSGRFVLGGPEADTGLTGRKLMVDSYGVFAPHGGGAFSGKDPTKVDRSGAYMARYIAKNLVAAGLCEKCQVTLAYAIGKAEPVMVEVDTFGTGTVCADDCLAEAVRFVFGLTPAEIISHLDLLTPRYTQTAAYGHFGKPEFPWERTDQAKILRAAVI